VRSNLFLLVFLFTFASLLAGVKEGYEALSVYDYFKARKIFYDVIKNKADPAACYGLALIHSRNDNPFYNNDTALKYIYRGYQAFLQSPKPASFAGVTVDSAAFSSMSRSLAARHLKTAMAQGNASALDAFILQNILAGEDIITRAVTLRDEMEFNRVVQVNQSDTTEIFIATHPQSALLLEARLLKDRQVFAEQTKSNSVAAFESFISKFPRNTMLNNAYQQLYLLLKQTSDVKGLATYVRAYPKAPQNLEAWKLLFSLTVKAYSFAEFKKFISEFPDFPLKSSVLRELELNKAILYPYQRGDYTGFIDTKGRVAISPQYDAASGFHEGLAVVNRNDSVFFVNKENANAFGRFFSDAYIFRNGIAPVRSEGQWYFINRLGQVISGKYDEISELSGQIYVIRKDSLYGALDQYGQPVIPPKFSKLGDFRNGYAYYAEDGKYGFVSTSGKVHKAAYDWISDFGTDGIAVIKSGNGYGLINNTGRTILESEHELVLRTPSSLYMIINAGNYGFYDPEKSCFTFFPLYEYQRDKQPSYYTDGRTFKLLRKTDCAIANANGALVAPFGMFEEVGLESCGLMKARKKKKYGFVDAKLNALIPYKYLDATDYADSVAMVKFKDGYIMLGAGGKELYESTLPVEKLSSNYYIADDGDSKTVINRRGETMTNDVVNIQRTEENMLILTLVSGEIKLLKD
jgi:hypothetical protein